MPDAITIGQRIAHARKLRGLTQAELAVRIPCSKSLVAQVERGHKPATPTLIAAAAKVLKVDVTELTGQPYRGSNARTDRIHAAMPASGGTAVRTAKAAGRPLPQPTICTG